MKFNLLILFIYSVPLIAQEDIRYIRQGNKSYNNEKFSDSELSYRKALENNSNSYKASFNLGDALYKQGKFEEAANQYQSLVNNDLDKETLSSIYHNLGNSYIQANKLKEGIEAYKQALRLNSNDMDTKYNLSHALRLLKQEEQKKEQNKDDKNKDNKDQEQKKEENKEQQKQEQKNEQEQQKQQAQEQKISKEQAEQMLKSMDNDEKDLQEKLKELQIKNKKNKLEKDW